MGPRLKTQQTPLGYEVKGDSYTLFFGNKQASFANIQKYYPQFQFTRVKQVHGHEVVEVKDTRSDYQIEADAHFTHLADIGLCMTTADCLPIFFLDSKSSVVAGIHAGWRGVANRIAPMTIERLQVESCEPKDIQVFIGPHIGPQSFEVDVPVREELLKSVSPRSDEFAKKFYTSLARGKDLVDLQALVMEQILQKGILKNNIQSLDLDTFAQPDFHSYRRDREKSGRQISFIIRHG